MNNKKHISLFILFLMQYNYVFVLPSMEQEHKEFKQKVLANERVKKLFESNDVPIEVPSLDDLINANSLSLIECKNAMQLHGRGSQERKDFECQLVDDIIETLEYLKKKRKLAFDIGVKIAGKGFLDDGGPLAYQPYHRVIVLKSDFMKLSPAIKLFALLHELQHCKQHEQYGAFDMSFGKSDHKAKEFEWEADQVAAKTIQCPVCLEVIKNSVKVGGAQRAIKGYMVSSDFDKIIDQLDTSTLCCAHKKYVDFKGRHINTIEPASIALLQRSESPFMRDRLSTLKFED